MQTYHVKLESEVSKSFRCMKAANSLDIDVEKKSVHDLKIQADLTGKYNVLLILGASGSGKTTLAKHIYGSNCFKTYLDLSKPVIEQFPEQWSYDDCAKALSGIGLTAVPCWIKPAQTLSNGQRARAEIALALANSSDKEIVIDEWTSVVDRTVAKVMSHSIQKYARREDRRVVLLSCHYDVVEWLDPDLVIDCNKEEFIDRRLLPPSERERKEKLRFDIKPIDKSSWPMFSKYHYLSEKLAGGIKRHFGLFHGTEQIGFQAFNNYVPRKKPTDRFKMHFNRTVIHPDYVGLGLGTHLINSTSQIVQNEGFEVMGKFSSVPVYKSLLRSPYWSLSKITRNIGNKSQIIMHEFRKTIRTNLTTYSFKFLGIPRADFASRYLSHLDSRVDLDFVDSRRLKEFEVQI